MEVKERVILPKEADVARAVHTAADESESGFSPGHWSFLVGFKDAFHTCPLRAEERQLVVYKDSDGVYHGSRAVQFGPSLDWL